MNLDRARAKARAIHDQDLTEAADWVREAFATAPGLIPALQTYLQMSVSTTGTSMSRDQLVTLKKFANLGLFAVLEIISDRHEAARKDNPA